MSGYRQAFRALEVAFDSTVSEYVVEIKKLKDKIRKLMRRPRDIGHGCEADWSFFGTNVDMGKMRAHFFWHSGCPAIAIRVLGSSAKKPLHTFRLNKDGTLEELDR